MTTSISIREITPLAENTTVVVAEGLRLLNTFKQLNDTPSDYTSQAKKSVRVNSSEDGLEFYEPSYTNLSDTDTTFTGKAKYIPAVNAEEDALVLSPIKVIDLHDVPPSYTGNGGKALTVKVTEDGMEFVDLLLKSTYDPNNIESDVYARANHTGQQSIATITNLQNALDGKTDIGHTHIIGDIANLQNELDSKMLNDVTLLTSLGSGTKGGGNVKDNLSIAVDILNTPEATNPLGTDVVLLETPTGLKKITVDNLINVSSKVVIRGWVTLDANSNTGTIHDPTLGDVRIDENGFIDGTGTPIPNPGVVDTWGYLVDSATQNSSVSGEIEDYAFADTLLFIEADPKPWGHVVDGVETFNGRAGKVLPADGDYNASQISATPVGSLLGDNVSAQIGEIENNKPNRSGNNTIDGDWSFTNILRLPEYTTGNYPAIGTASIIYDTLLHQYIGVRNGVWEVLGSGSSGGAVPNYTLTADDVTLVSGNGYLFDTTTKAILGTLPEGVAGDWFAANVVGTASNLVTLTPFGTQKIDGGSSYILDNDKIGTVWYYVSDAIGWVMIYGVGVDVNASYVLTSRATTVESDLDFLFDTSELVGEPA